MFRPTSTLAVIGLALCAASCRSSPSDARRQQWEEGSLVHRTVTGYHVIVSAKRGKVGFLKVEDVTEGGGAPYPWKYVQDLDHRELGFVDQMGNAYRYHYYSPAEAAQQNEDLRLTRLPSDSIENNVMRILGLDTITDQVTFPTATQADITGDTGVQHLAGPGVVPAKAPAK